MGQTEVLDVLHKAQKPLSLGEICRELNARNNNVINTISKMIKYNEVKIIEIDRYEAMEKYGCKRRMRLYYV